MRQRTVSSNLTLSAKNCRPPQGGSAIFIGEEIRKVKSDSPVDCRREAPASRTSIFAANAAKMQSNLHSPPASNQAKASNQRVPRIPTDLRTGRKQSNLHSPLPIFPQHILCILTPSPLHKKPHCAIIKEKTEGLRMRKIFRFLCLIYLIRTIAVVVGAMAMPPFALTPPSSTSSLSWGILI